MSFPNHVRSFLRAVRDALDGRLHSLRRRRSRNRLVGLNPSNMLFVCLGNVCRSPYGERVMAAKHPVLSVQSAGFIGPGRSPPDTALAVALARGVDHSDHRSKLVTADALETAHAVFVFDRRNVKRIRAAQGARMDRVFWLGDFDSTWTGTRAIADPWGKSRAEFDEAFARIERCVGEVLDAIRPGS